MFFHRIMTHLLFILPYLLSPIISLIIKTPLKSGCCDLPHTPTRHGQWAQWVPGECPTVPWICMDISIILCHTILYGSLYECYLVFCNFLYVWIWNGTSPDLLCRPPNHIMAVHYQPNVTAAMSIINLMLQQPWPPFQSRAFSLCHVAINANIDVSRLFIHSCSPLVILHKFMHSLIQSRDVITVKHYDIIRYNVFEEHKQDLLLSVVNRCDLHLSPIATISWIVLSHGTAIVPFNSKQWVRSETMQQLSRCHLSRCHLSRCLLSEHS